MSVSAVSGMVILEIVVFHWNNGLPNFANRA
jgi:hypothetical protein